MSLDGPSGTSRTPAAASNVRRPDATPSADTSNPREINPTENATRDRGSLTAPRQGTNDASDAVRPIKARTLEDHNEVLHESIAQRDRAEGVGLRRQDHDTYDAGDAIRITHYRESDENMAEAVNDVNRITIAARRFADDGTVTQREANRLAELFTTDNEGGGVSIEEQGAVIEQLSADRRYLDTVSEHLADSDQEDARIIRAYSEQQRLGLVEVQQELIATVLNQHTGEDTQATLHASNGDDLGFTLNDLRDYRNNIINNLRPGIESDYEAAVQELRVLQGNDADLNALRNAVSDGAGNTDFEVTVPEFEVNDDGDLVAIDDSSTTLGAVVDSSAARELLRISTDEGQLNPGALADFNEIADPYSDASETLLTNLAATIHGGGTGPASGDDGSTSSPFHGEANRGFARRAYENNLSPAQRQDLYDDWYTALTNEQRETVDTINATDNGVHNGTRPTERFADLIDFTATYADLSTQEQQQLERYLSS